MFRMEIKTGNVAFCDPYTGNEDSFCERVEVARILKKVIECLENDYIEGSCIDINGNKVGTWKLS
ncbi:MAG: hypothetical protein K6F00_11165 [Lachnospiraceae bacterium]|nr:hypothetical protein [Lachnospiraceae bacterium]